MLREWRQKKEKKSVLKYFDFSVKQVAGLAGENPGPSRRLEIAAHLSLIRNNLFDHRTPHFHPLWVVSSVSHIEHVLCCQGSHLYNGTIIFIIMQCRLNVTSIVLVSMDYSPACGWPFQVLVAGHHFPRSGRRMRLLLAPRHWQFLALSNDHRFAGQALADPHHVFMYRTCWTAVCTLVRLNFSYRYASLDPTFIYNASVAISRLKLPNWAEPFAGNI